MFNRGESPMMPNDELSDLATKIAFPLATTVLSELLKRGQTKKLERIEQWIKSLHSDIQKLQLKCDDESIVDLIHKILNATASDAREEKLSIYNLVLKDRYCATIDDLHSRIFVDFTARFDAHHLHILKTLRDVKGTDSGNNNTLAPAIGFAYLDSQLRNFMKIDSREITDITTLALYDLVNSGLVHTRMQKESSSRIITEINPVGLLRMQVFTLSHLGTLFSKYIESHANTSSLKANASNNSR